ncbi:DUF155-domain-containing protein [Artomyces pyxidatus]|uniref:DUF155-domain-containing protein n=1 Tax=Artomyces pyxidatus TaxID=48021 RepID=A0ACB8TEL4_9AGAM|nr:DUF155-domain-containing protein [Artomyces pyxidatus]
MSRPGSLPRRPSRVTSGDRPRLSSANRRPSISLPLSLSRPSAPTAASSAQPTATTNRTSKTHQKLVVLPSDPQTKPFPDDAVHGYETDAGVGVRERKSAAERMTKSERRRAGCRRITAYCVAEGFGMKVLASFLKREHNVVPRTFDEALYVMYHLPLLPGYSPSANIRSSPAPAQQTHMSRMDEAEANGYQGTYFTSTSPAGRRAFSMHDGYISGGAGSPEQRRRRRTGDETEDETENERDPSITEDEGATAVIARGELETEEEIDAAEETDLAGEETDIISPLPIPKSQPIPLPSPSPLPGPATDDSAEAVFFAYGVVVFFGFEESQERSVLEDVAGAGAVRRIRPEDDWEVEECHYAYDQTIAYPRIYNDYFTFKSPSHLLTLSISHAIAQSTLLAHYETLANSLLAHPRTLALPKTLARTGTLAMSRTDAMRLTGRLFRLRRDVVLGGNVLDIPSVFWEEASLRGLYDAVRAYFEIGERVNGLSERIGGASELLDTIHDNLNNNAMERITWIIIWLIVVACLVELGEIIARLVVHATLRTEAASAAAEAAVFSVQTARGMVSVDREEAMRILERVLNGDLSQ